MDKLNTISCIALTFHTRTTIRWLIASVNLCINVSFTIFIGYHVNRFTSTDKNNKPTNNEPKTLKLTFCKNNIQFESPDELRTLNVSVIFLNTHKNKHFVFYLIFEVLTAVEMFTVFVVFVVLCMWCQWYDDVENGSNHFNADCWQMSNVRWMI